MPQKKFSPRGARGEVEEVRVADDFATRTRLDQVLDQFLQTPMSQSREPISWPRLRPVPGVNDTPRSTSPDFAVRTVVKLSLAGSVVALSLSLITTSLFGSAPWSPLPLTVEVMA